MKRTPGRPPLDDDDPSVPVHVKIPSKQYDELDARAKREGLTVPDVIRRAVQRDAEKKNLK